MASYSSLAVIWLLLILGVVASAFGLPKRQTYGRHGRPKVRPMSHTSDERPYQRRLPLLQQNKKSSSSSTSDDSESSPKTLSTGVVAVTGFAAVTAAAKLGLLQSSVYTDAMIAQDLGSAIVCAVAATIYIQGITVLAARGILESRDSRKLIHTLSAPLFMVCWPLFTAAPGARYFAATVAGIKAVRLYLAGAGGRSERSLANAVSRSGDAGEALGGPFIYVLLLAAFVLAFWRDSPVGIIALATLAVGDGLADLVGRRLGQNNKWPGLDKSVAGSLAFWIGSTVASVGLLQWMSYWNCLYLPYELADLTVRVAGITLVSAILELVPVADDNYTVPISAALVSLLVLQ